MTVMTMDRLIERAYGVNRPIEFETSDMPGRRWVDLLILTVFVIFATLLTVYKIRQDSTQFTNQYNFVPVASCKLWLISFAVFSSFNSTIAIVCNPVEVYKHGLVTVWNQFGYIMIAWLGMGLNNFFYRIDIVSIHQYILGRFGHRTVNYCINLFLMFLVINLMVAISASGIPFWASVPIMCMTAGLVTNKGGLRVLIWLDVLHFFVELVTLTSIIIKGSILYDIKPCQNCTSHLLDWYNFDTRPESSSTSWSFMFSSAFMWLAYLSTNNLTLAKVFMCSHQRQIKWMMLINIITHIVFYGLYILIGVFMDFHFSQLSRADRKITSANEMLSTFIVNGNLELETVLPGLYFFAIYFSGWTSILSGFNAIALTLYVDILHGRGEYTKHNEKMISFLVYIYALLATLIPFTRWGVSDKLWMEKITSSLTLCPVLGVCLLGIFSQRSNSKGATAGLLVSNILVLFFLASDLMTTFDGYPENVFDDVRRYRARKATGATLSHDWYPTLAVMSVIIVGYVVSVLADLIGPQKPRRYDSRLSISLFGDLVPFNRRRAPKLETPADPEGGLLAQQLRGSVKRKEYPFAETNRRSFQRRSNNATNDADDGVFRTAKEQPKEATVPSPKTMIKNLYAKTFRSNSYTSTAEFSPADP